MRACIVTIKDFKNYGNRLQNYALDSLLKRKNIEVVNGLYVRSLNGWVSSNDAKKRILAKVVPFFVFKNLWIRQDKKVEDNRSDLMKKKIERCKAFSDKYVKTLENYYVKNDEMLRNQIGDSEIDFYVTGSDQVWNPYFAGYDYDFLTFTDKKKRFSFAASIGVDEIPDKKKELFKNGLNNMQFISVREAKAAEIVKDLTGKDSEVCLDPTLCIDVEEWRRVEEKPAVNLPEHYIATYFLGDIPKNIRDYAEKNNLALVEMNNEKVAEYFTLNPAEFLYVINHADMMFTDSFHAVVFSIQFKTQFTVFYRTQKNVKSMSSRIDNILGIFGLQNQIHDDQSELEVSHISDDVWTETHDKLETLRETQVERFYKELNV